MFVSGAVRARRPSAPSTMLPQGPSDGERAQRAAHSMDEAKLELVRDWLTRPKTHDVEDLAMPSREEFDEALQGLRTRAGAEAVSRMRWFAPYEALDAQQAPRVRRGQRGLKR